MLPSSSIYAIPVTAALAAALVALLRRSREQASSPSAQPPPPPLRHNLRELQPSDVPLELRVAHYVDLDAAEHRGYEHAAYLRMAHDVGAVLDGLHEYIMACLFACNQQMRKSAKEVLRIHPTLNANVCPSVGHAFVWLEAAEPADRERVFAPERIIGSETAPSDASLADGTAGLLMVGAGAKILGGCFDVSQGPIWLADHVTIEPGALIRGPAFVGSGCTFRHGAYLRGDCMLGANGVFGGELKARKSRAVRERPSARRTRPTHVPCVGRGCLHSTARNCRTPATAAIRSWGTALTLAARH